MVLNTIDDAKKGAARSSAYAYIEEVETEVAKYMLDNNGNKYSTGKHTVADLATDLGVEVKGDAPSEGKVCIGSDGIVTKASLKINNYVVSYDGKETTTTDLDTVEDITCDEVVLGGPTKVLPTNGETYKAIVYLDPTNLTKTCDASNSISTTGTKEGCMKWYAYSDDGTNYTMILDHNTTAMVAWNSSGNNEDGMNEVATALTSDTETWTNGLNPRLITAVEIAQITGNTTFNQSASTASDWFYFDSNSQTKTATAQGESNYTWLFDYTNGCTSYGCNVADSSTYGYWTSTPEAGGTISAWRVGRDSALGINYVDYASYSGVRPVITLSKSILS